LRDGSLGNYLLRAAHVGDAGLRNRIGCRRGVASSDNPAPALAKLDQVCRKSIKPGLGLVGFRNASATVPGREFPLCMSLSACVADSSGLQRRADDSEFRASLLVTWHLDAGRLEEQASKFTQATHRRRPSFGRTRRTQSRPRQATNRSDEAETRV